jgi:hypothetical protein
VTAFLTYSASSKRLAASCYGDSAGFAAGAGAATGADASAAASASSWFI